MNNLINPNNINIELKYIDKEYLSFLYYNYINNNIKNLNDEIFEKIPFIKNKNINIIGEHEHYNKHINNKLIGLPYYVFTYINKDININYLTIELYYYPTLDLNYYLKYCEGGDPIYYEEYSDKDIIEFIKADDNYNIMKNIVNMYKKINDNYSKLDFI